MHFIAGLGVLVLLSVFFAYVLAPAVAALRLRLRFGPRQRPPSNAVAIVIVYVVLFVPVALVWRSSADRVSHWMRVTAPAAVEELFGGSGSAAPLEDVMAKRADAAPINRIPWVPMNNKVKGLKVLPGENNCQNSTEKATPVGLAIEKNQPEFLAWLQAVAQKMQPQLEASEQKVIETMK